MTKEKRNLLLGGTALVGAVGATLYNAYEAERKGAERIGLDSFPWDSEEWMLIYAFLTVPALWAFFLSTAPFSTVPPRSKTKERGR